MTMEYKEHYSGRWIFFFGGVFWVPAIVIAYILMLDELLQEQTGRIILVTAMMLILFLAAVKILSVGITGFYVDGKKHLVLKEDSLEIIINSGKFKGTVYHFAYTEIQQFYFISDGTKKNKNNGRYYVKENSSGTISFMKNKLYYDVSVYNALPAAKFILENLEYYQIDNSKNELDKNGNYTPKD